MDRFGWIDTVAYIRMHGYGWMDMDDGYEWMAMDGLM